MKTILTYSFILSLFLNACGDESKKESRSVDEDNTTETENKDEESTNFSMVASNTKKICKPDASLFFGDLNGNGRMDSWDSWRLNVYLLNKEPAYVAKLSCEQLSRLDFDGDNLVTSADLAILNKGVLRLLYLGDFNLNGKVDSWDSWLMNRNLLKLQTLNEFQKRQADLDRNGKIDQNDYKLLLKYLLGKTNIPL